MKLKYSNKFPFPFLFILGLLALLLLFFSKSKGESKYPETPEFKQKTNLDLIQITLTEKAFVKLEKKRFKALVKGILETSDSDYVPTTISFNGEDFKAEVRLKGDWTDHLIGNKWSFRIKLKDDKTILGMRKFSIHHPQTRGHHYLAEWLYMKAIKRENLIGLRYTFLEGAIHIKIKNTTKHKDRDLGFYALEESFDKRTLESNKAKESIILKFSEDNWWNEVRQSLEVGATLGYTWEDFMNNGLVERAKFPILPFSEEKTILDSTMRSYFIFSKSLLDGVLNGGILISDAFDSKKLAMQNAILNLFGGVHGTYIINLRFYYNPITSKLEPIAFDANSGNKLEKYKHFMFVDQKKDSIYLKELAYVLEKVSNPEYLKDLISEYKEEMEQLEKPLIKEFYSEGLSIENLEYNQKVIREELVRIKNKYDIKNISLKTGLIDEIKVIEVSSWINNNTTLAQTPIKYNNSPVYNISRENMSSSSYTVITDNEINYGGNYRTSIIVKKGNSGTLFGLRTQGVYPNRLDAVFDLEKGEVKEESVGGNFEKINTIMKPLGDGWYYCSISGQINANNLQIILGPTTREKNSSSWEGATNKNCDVYIIPSSLLIEEVVH